MKIAIKQQPANSGGWTPILAPNNCNQVYFKCLTSRLKISSDPEDPTTEDTLEAGIQQIYGSPPAPTYLGGIRFQQGETIVYVQLETGTGPVIVTGVI